MLDDWILYVIDCYVECLVCFVVFDFFFAYLIRYRSVEFIEVEFDVFRD